ncbi:MAG: hypothetical protein AB7P12_12455 [Alphaproteobacteria bacterium]
MNEKERLSLEQRAMQGAQMTPEERKKMWLAISPAITEAEFDAFQADRRARQARAPKPGRMAPDFEIDVLSPERKRTGERVRLSALRGQLVGLVFGSYT